MPSPNAAEEWRARMDGTVRQCLCLVQGCPFSFSLSFFLFLSLSFCWYNTRSIYHDISGFLLSCYATKGAKYECFPHHSPVYCCFSHALRLHLRQKPLGVTALEYVRPGGIQMGDRKFLGLRSVALSLYRHTQDICYFRVLPQRP